MANTHELLDNIKANLLAIQLDFEANSDNIQDRATQRRVETMTKELRLYLRPADGRNDVTPTTGFPYWPELRRCCELVERHKAGDLLTSIRELT